MQIKESTREAFDEECRRLVAKMGESARNQFGPNRDETLEAVEARVARQAVALELVTALAEWHGNVTKYTDPLDWARNLATMLYVVFDIRERR